MIIAGLGLIGTTGSGTVTSGGTTTPPTTTTPTTPTTPTPVVSATPTKVGNRLDVIFDQAVVSPGDTVTGKVWINGLWPTTAGKTASLAGGPTVALPTAGSAPVNFSFTAGTTGEYSFAVTNTAGLINPYPPPLTVFTPSSGVDQTFSASFAKADGSAQVDLAIYQQDAIAGAPRGFNTAGWFGWGEVWLNYNGPATDGFWGRPYSAFSANASSTLGTGTALDNAIQIHGPISGPGKIRVLLPVCPYSAYWDTATNSGMTKAVRVQQRIGVGHVEARIGRSIMHTMTGSYAYGPNQVPLGTNYPDTCSLTSFDPNNGGISSGSTAWFRNDGVGTYLGEGSSSGDQEWARIMATKRGAISGVVGLIANGASLDKLVAHDGTPNNAFYNTVAYACGYKARSVQLEGVTGGGEWGDGTYPYSTAEVATRFGNFVSWVTAHMPAASVITLHAGASGWFGNDGSALPYGYNRNQALVCAAIASANPMVASRHDSVWNDRYGGHPTMVARISMAEAWYQQYAMAESAAWGGLQVPYDQRGPTFGTTAKISGNVIRVPVKLNGGTKLVARTMDPGGGTLTPKYYTPSAAELASAFGVYPGSSGRWGNGTPVNTTKAEINTTNVPAGFDATIDITVFRNSDGTLQNWWGDNRGSDGVYRPQSQAYPSDGTFTIQQDFGTSNSACAPSFTDITHGDIKTAVFLTDDVIDTASGIPFGREPQPFVDIVASPGS